MTDDCESIQALPADISESVICQPYSHSSIQYTVILKIGADSVVISARRAPYQAHQDGAAKNMAKQKRSNMRKSPHITILFLPLSSFLIFFFIAHFRNFKAESFLHTHFVDKISLIFDRSLEKMLIATIKFIHQTRGW